MSLVTPLTRARSVSVAFVALAAVAALASGCTSSGTPGSVVASSDSGSTSSSAAPSADKSSTTAKRSTTTEDESGDPTTVPDDPAEAPDACDLITEDDAVEAFGEPASPGEQSRDECWWHGPNDLKTINLIRRTGDVDEWRDGLQNDHWEKIDLGDEAYSGRTLDSITFRLDETIYEVNVVYSTKGEPDRIVRELADKVINRL